MRRIYESDALHRDDDDPHSPSELDERDPGPSITANQNRSMLNWARLSHAVLPVAIRNRAIAVSLETDRAVYGPDQPVGIRVRFRNRLPFPITLRTPTRRRWDWAIDGLPRAAREEFEPAPAEATRLQFYRSETKTFTRTWHQRFRTAADRWEPAEPGTYEVAAFVAVDDPAGRGLRAATEIELTG
jgi:hypothetical protein